MKEGVLGYDDCRALVGAYGVGVPEGAMAGSEDEAAAAALKIGYPVVMKGQSPQIPHKTEAGLVQVGIKNESVFEKRMPQWYAGSRAMIPRPNSRGFWFNG